MNVALICIGLLAALLFGLGFGVSASRGRTEKLYGHSSDPTDPLHKWVRAHANTAEYAPMLAVLMLANASQGAATWVLWCMGIATLSRYSIAIGLIASSTLEAPHPLRLLGALGTYLSGLALAVALIL